jgi:hypothetical protein
MAKDKVTVKGGNYKKLIITQSEKDTLMSISQQAVDKGEHGGLAAFTYLIGIDRFKSALSSIKNTKEPSVVISPVPASAGKYTVFVGEKDLTLTVTSAKTTKSSPTKQKSKGSSAPTPTSSSSPSSSPATSSPSDLGSSPDMDDGGEEVGSSGGRRVRGGYYTTVSKSGRLIRRRFRTGSDYEQAEISASKGLDQLTAERLASGESLGSAIGGGISERTQAAVTNVQRKFDPINLAQNIPLIGKSLAAMVGKDRPDDLAAITGIQGRIPDEDDLIDDYADDSGRTKFTAKKISRGSSSVDGNAIVVLSVIAKNTMALVGMSRDLNVIRQNVISIGKHLGAKTTNKADIQMLKEGELEEKADVQSGQQGLLSQIRDILADRMKKDDISDNFEEENSKEESDRHKELVDAILGVGKGNKTAKKEKDEKDESKGGFLDKAKGMMGGAKDALKGLGDMAKGVLALAASLWIISKALQNFATISWESVAKGITTLAALALSTKLIKEVDSSKALLALGASLFIVSKALENFADISWESIGKGVISLAALAASTKLLSGGVSAAASLILLAAGVWAISKALQSFADLSWEDIGKGILSIGLLAAGASALSGLAPAIAITAAAIGLLGGAIWLLGKGLASVSESFDLMVENIKSLGELDGMNLLKVAAGIGAISLALLAFGGAQMATALTNLVTNFLSIGQDSPVEQLEKIGQAGPGIEKAADGMERLADAMQKFSDIDADNFSDLMDTLNDFPWLKATMYAAAGGVFNVTTKQGTISGGAGKYAQPGQAPAESTTPSAIPGKSASKVTTSSGKVSGSLSGVTIDQIKSHPNFKKYYDQAISEGSDKVSAIQEATMMVKEDMIKEQSKVAPVSQPQPLSSRMNDSVKENLSLTSQQNQGSAPVIVNSPSSTTVVNNNSGGGMGVVPGVRNDDSVLTRLQYQNYRII